MTAFLIVSVTCPDQPGVVGRVSEALLAGNGNWEESWMGRLGGVFAGIIKVSAEEEYVEGLVADLMALNSDEMSILVQPSQEEDPFTDYRSMHIRLSGADHEGIVHSLAAFLAERGVNVEKLQTQIAPAPLTGGPLFMAMVDIQCPPSLPMEDLRAELETMSTEQAVDITLVDTRKATT